MDPEHAQEIAERDQLWASLRNLRGEIDRVAAGEFFEDAERLKQLIVLLARIVASEMDFRERHYWAE